MLDSIQIAQLAEGIEALYCRDVNFVDWLSTKSIKDPFFITVGNISEFIADEICTK